MVLSERITIDTEICHGNPTIRGLRYPVEMILKLRSSGMTLEEILADYEDLEREEILAALSFAARLARSSGLNLRGMRFLYDAHFLSAENGSKLICTR